MQPGPWRRSGMTALGWRDETAALQQEVQQKGLVSLDALAATTTSLAAAVKSSPAAYALDAPGVTDGLVLLAQQLEQRYTTASNTVSAAAVVGSKNSQPQHVQHAQQQGGQHGDVDLLLLYRTCCTYCELVTVVLSSVTGQPQQQQQNDRRRHRGSHQQQQQQKSMQSNLSKQAATAICSCLRRWADQQPCCHHSSSSSSSSTAAAAVQAQLQRSALSAVEATLVMQWSVLPIHERAAMLTLLQALAQPLRSSSRSGALLQDCCCCSQHALSAAHTAVFVLGQLCKHSSSCGLNKDEHSSIMRAVVDALAAACGGSSGSSSTGRLVEDAAHAKYYFALLVALHQSVAADQSGWQRYAAAAVTEAARKLLVYGLQQQQQQHQQAAAATATVAEVPADVAVVTSGIAATSMSSALHAANAASSSRNAAAAHDSSSSSGSKVRYLPPHLRAAAAAAAVSQTGTPSKRQNGSLQQQQQQQGQQQQQQDAASDIDSSSEWSDSSDTEQSTATRRWSSSSSSSSSSTALSGRTAAAADAAAAVQDPIKAYKVRIALLQLLQTMVQLDAKALHPFLSALLPSQQQPLQQRPLSPHLATVLLYDPCSKARVLSAAVILSLLEGSAARALFAVAEEKIAHRNTAVRGFTSISTTLGHMLIALHTALLAAAAAMPRSQQQQQQQQAAAVLVPSAALLCSTLRVLSALVAVTPYDRLPSTLLTDVINSMWQLWRQQQQCGSWEGDVSVCSTAAVAVVAQAMATKKPDAGVAAWLQKHICGNATDQAAVAAAARSDLQQQQQQQADKVVVVPQLAVQVPTTSSSSSSMLLQLLSAAVSDKPLLRIEALAALRGCCINYPKVLMQSGGGDLCHGSSSSSGSSSSGSWTAVVAAVRCNIGASLQIPRTPRGTPVTGGAAASGSSSSSDEVSASTSPEDKALQHAVKLLGEYLAAAWKVTTCDSSTHSTDCNTKNNKNITSMWSDALDLLLSDQLQQHPSYMIRSSAAAVLADIPAAVWQQQQQQQQRLLAAVAAAAQHDAVTAARAAACKALGSLIMLPGVLTWQQQQQDNHHHHQQQQQQCDLVLQPLTAGVRDSAVSVRLSASWAVANACDALKAAVTTSNVTLDQQNSSAAAAGSGYTTAAATAPLLQRLCELAVTAAGDNEKVRANGIRAIGALLAAWQPQWHSSSSTGSSSSSDWCWVPGWLRSAVFQLQSCLASRSPKVVWNAAYAAAGLMQNTALLQHDVQVSASTPSLLCVLVVLVRDSNNYKIKTHAAAALAALNSRLAYGDCYADAVLVLAAALDNLGSSSSSSDATGSSSSSSSSSGSQGVVSAAADGGDDDGSFPNYRYIPGLVAQLQSSLLHLLALAQPTDTTRLKDPLQRHKQQLINIIKQMQEQDNSTSGATAAATAALAALSSILGGSVANSSSNTGQYLAAAAARVDAAQQRLPSDPFSQDR